MKKIKIGVFALYRILCILSIVLGYGSVKENLSGWHGFSGGSAIWFVIICLLLAGLSLIALRLNSTSDSKNAAVFISALLMILPFVMHFYASAMAGNVRTDYQYLLLRIFQGFDATYIMLGIIGLVCVVISNYRTKEIEN